MSIFTKISKALVGKLNNLVDGWYISEIHKSADNFYYMAEPSEKVILALAEKAPEWIPYIKAKHSERLTDDVKKAIVLNNLDSIKYFSDDLKLTSHILKHYSGEISEETKLCLVAKNASYIGDIKNPSEKVQVNAVLKDNGCITLIESPCEAAQRISVAKDPFVLTLIDTTEQVRLAAINRDPENLKFIKEPSFTLIKMCVENNPEFIYYVQKYHEYVLTEDVKREMITSNPMLLKYFADVNKGSYHLPVLSKDDEFKSAFETGNSVKLSDLKSEGYMPSSEVMDSLSRPFSDSTAITVQKLFGIELPGQCNAQLVENGPTIDMKHHLLNTVGQTL